MQATTKIDFVGTPIIHGGRLAKIASFMARNDIKLAALSAAFCIAADQVTGQPLTSAGSSILGLTSFALLTMGVELLRALEQTALSWKTSKTTIKEKCIETKPGNELPPNLEKWGMTSKLIRNGYAGLALGDATMTAYECIKATSYHETTTALCVGALFACRYISGALRWHNVYTGKWRIEDKGPPPEPVKKRRAQRLFRLFPGTNPT